jgi:hypothetical protein
LNLSSSENPVSKLAFKCNLHRYAVERVDNTREGLCAVGGLYTLRIQLTHSLKPPGFKP